MYNWYLIDVYYILYNVYTSLHTPSICNSVCVLFHVLSSGLQDFANQVKYSQRYAEALKRTNSKAGKYVSPTTGEYFSGLGLPVSLEFGAQVMLLEVSPKGGRAWSPIAWTKLLFDGSFLIKTSRLESLSQLMWMQCSLWQATDNKMAAVSLFTGVSGLELGLAKPDSQELNKFWVLVSCQMQVLSWCVVEMKFLRVIQLFGFRRLKLEGHSIFIWDLSQCSDFWQVGPNIFCFDSWKHSGPWLPTLWLALGTLNLLWCAALG